MAESEIKHYSAELRRRPLFVREDSSDSGGPQIHTRQRQRRRPNRRNSRRAEETGRNRLTTRALYDTDVSPFIKFYLFV